MGLTSIDGKKRPMCPHCGLVPADQHPNETCFRIHSYSVSDDGHEYEYISAEDFKAMCEELGYSLPGFGKDELDTETSE